MSQNRGQNSEQPKLVPQGGDGYNVHGASAGSYPRLEVETLQKDEYQWSLFMQALRNIQQKGYKRRPASFQDIGGIHGIPYSRWSGDPAGKPTDDTNSKNGYCFHSSVLFPTWHRVYMLLMEQSLSEEAKEIAAEMSRESASQSERDNWASAADALRLPFWDWSAQEVKTMGLPLVFMKPIVDVRGSGSKTIRLDPNPLHQFIFNEIPADAQDHPDQSEEAYFTQWRRTYRYPRRAAPDLPLREPNVTEAYDELNEQLLKNTDARRDKLRRLFSYPADDSNERMWATYYDYFASTGPQSAQDFSEQDRELLKSRGSLESPHNSVHNDLGGNGNMSWPDIASFDPIFFFHHCNVDRLQALWEYCYPNYWLGKGYFNKKGDLLPFKDSGETYQSDPTVTEDSPLAPFRKSDDAYWNSKAIRGPQEVLKTYTYPPIVVDVRGHTITIDMSKPATADERKVYIGALQVYFADPSVPLPERSNRKIALPPIFDTAPRTKMPEALLTLLRGYRDFIVLASLPQYAFKGSYRLEMYVDDTLVNELSVFARLAPESCANCAGRIAAGTAFVEGALGIPHAAVIRVLEKEACNARDVTEDKVIAAITNHLSARIVTPDGRLLASHAASVGPTPEFRGPKLAAEQWPSLKLVSSRIAMSNRSSDTLEPDTPFDWRHHGAVLSVYWSKASRD